MMYDTEMGRIEILPLMTRKRNGGTAVFTDDVIIVIGGANNFAEFYDFRTNAWQIFKAIKYVKCMLTVMVNIGLNAHACFCFNSAHQKYNMHEEISVKHFCFLGV